MGTFNITIEDDEDGFVRIKSSFDPPLPENMVDGTPAQIQGATLLYDLINSAADVESANPDTARVVSTIRDDDLARFEDDGGSQFRTEE